MTLRRKILIILFLIIYNISFLLNFYQFMPDSFFKNRFGGIENTYAEDPVTNIGLVAIFVDNSIYDKIETDLKWYTDYIQTGMDRTKALVFPVNVANFQAKDIAKMLENLYLEGSENGSSSLVGTILIGDIPLPVVNKSGYIYPSIYPYVDFKDRKFIYNPNTDFFDYNDIVDGKPEIWHGIINFKDDIKAYADFFGKIKEYKKNPVEYVDKKVWVEDFNHLRQVFTSFNEEYYLNNFVFLEDLMLKRHTPLLLDIMFEDYRKFIKDKVNVFSKNIDQLKKEADFDLGNADPEFDDFKKISDIYFSGAESFRNKYQNYWIDDDKTGSGEQLDDMASKTPTLVISSAMKGFLKNYYELFSPEYMTDIKDDILATGRWYEEDVDFHIPKAYYMDEMAKRLVVDFNKAVEKMIDGKIKKEGYSMAIPIPDIYENWHNNYVCLVSKKSENRNQENVQTSKSGKSKAYSVWGLIGRYENFYMGRPMFQVNEPQDFSYYRGTYLNFIGYEQLTGYTLYSGGLEDINVSVGYRSVGASNSIFNRQIEANRGINVELADEDGDDYMNNRCSPSEDVEQWSRRWYGGSSPLNIEVTKTTDFYLKEKKAKIAWNPSYDRTIGGPLYDIAGSRLTEFEMLSGYNYLGYDDYASMLKTQHHSFSSYIDQDGDQGNKAELVNDIYCQATDKDKLSYDSVDLFNVFGGSTGNQGGDGTYMSISAKGKNGTVNSAGGNQICLCYDENVDEGTISGISGNKCLLSDYRSKQIYNYKVVTTITEHKSPDIPELTGLNMITRERPIDDPRYVSFKGIGGDNVNILYPDFFRVEIYKRDGNKVVLKSKEEIELAIRDYLKKKIGKYNKDLAFQLGKSKSYYSKNSGAFDFLSGADGLATPNRTYHLMTGSYISDELGDKNIKRIASALYYLNVGFNERYDEDSGLVSKHDKDKLLLTATDISGKIIDNNSDDIINVLQDIDAEKNSYDINRKIKYLNDVYMKSGQDTDYLTNIDYVPEGYEVGYINSDGIDTLYRSDVPDEILRIQESQSFNKYGGFGNNGNLNYVFASLSAMEDDMECGVDPDGSVIIWRWPSAFMCRMQKTLAKPFELSIDYSCSMGDILDEYADAEDYYDDEYRRGGWDEYYIDNGLYNGGGAEYFRTEYDDYVQDHDDQYWEPYINNWNPYMGSDKMSNRSIEQTLSDTQRQELNDIKSNITTTIYPSNNVGIYQVAEKAPTTIFNTTITKPNKYYLKIDSSQDIGEKTIDIASIGNNCVLINGTDICKKNYSIDVNPYREDVVLPLEFVEKDAGTTIIQTRVCDDDSLCYYDNETLFTLPGSLNKIDIVTPSDKVLKGGTLPVAIKGYDKYGNNVGQTIEDYVFSANIGNIENNGKPVRGVYVNDFDRSYYLYDTSSLTGFNGKTLEASLQVAPSKIYTQLKSKLPTKTKKIQLVEGGLKLYQGNKNVDNLTYKLPETIDPLYGLDKNDISQLYPDSLIKLRLELKANDGSLLSSPVEVRFDKGVMVPGILNTDPRYIISSGASKRLDMIKFVRKNSFIIENGYVELYLHPSFRAGKDNLIFSVKGLKDLVIPVEVLPASAKVLNLKLQNNRIDLDGTTKGSVEVQDIWGNITYNQDIVINVGIFGNAEIGGKHAKSFMTKGGIVEFQVNGYDPGGKVYVYSEIKGKSLGEYAGDYEELWIKNTLWPKEDLNVMYMNLYGTDWGNQWGFFSDNNNVATDIIKDSDKMISMTTELVDPTKVSKAMILIRDDLKMNNYDLISTYLNVRDGKLIMTLGTLPRVKGEVSLGNLKEFKIQRSDKIPEKMSGNSIYYVPDPTDNNITSNILSGSTILINNIPVIDFNRGVFDTNIEIKLNSITKENGNSFFSIRYKKKSVGKLFLNRDDNYISQKSLADSRFGKDADAQIGFAGGSTNGEKGLIVYSKLIAPSDDTKMFRSVEDTKDIDFNGGFREDFKNVNNFANGMSVGESSVVFASDYLVNYGDPLLIRKDLNPNLQGVKLDGGVGQTIYSDPERGFIKAIDMDFNNDGLQDVIVAYNNGSIRILKNYGGNNPFKDLGDLVVISDGIKDVYGGDVDGNGYDDIIVWTTKDMLRVYTNDSGVFDVNGIPICLDVAGGPDSVKGVSQLFVEDMNKDGSVDLVTNDLDGDVKLFYGGKTELGYNYLSKDIYSCDSGRLERQKTKVMLIKSYGIAVSSGAKVYDESLVHRKGLERPNPMIPSQISPAQSSGNALLMNKTASGTNQSSDMYTTMKYVDLPSKDYIPSYETVEKPSDTVSYVKLGYMDQIEPVDVYKTYNDVNGGRLEMGDVVEITVHFDGKDDPTNATFIDNLKGPWVLVEDEDDRLMGFDTTDMDGDYQVEWNKDIGLNYMVDNINIKSGEQQFYTYLATYQGEKLVNIDVREQNDEQYFIGDGGEYEEIYRNPDYNKYEYYDNYEDIIVYPEDGCMDGYWEFVSKNDAMYYDERFNNLEDKYVNKIEDSIRRQEIEQDLLTEDIQDMVDEGTISEFLGRQYGDEILYSEDDSFIDYDYDEFGDGNYELRIEPFDGMLGNLQGVLFNVLKGLCTGFKFGANNCPFIPIPFNKAFFSPGFENFMGCPLGIDLGTPIFWYPGTLWVPTPECGVPIPTPMMKTVIGPPIEMLAPSGCLPIPVYNSQIRLYLSPTLTQGLGFAACFGPYISGMTTPPIPTGMGMFYGNCVVAATMLGKQCDKDKHEYGPGIENYVIEDWQYDLAEMGECDGQRMINGRRTSPFTMVGYGDGGRSYGSDLYYDNYYRGRHYADMMPDGNILGGLIDIQKTPYIMKDSSGQVRQIRNVSEYMNTKMGDAIKDARNGTSDFIKGGISTTLQIEGGDIKGLIQCIIKKWLDRQLRYIINNLTNMTIYLILPDFTGLTEGWDKLMELPGILQEEWSIFTENISNLNFGGDDSVEINDEDNLGTRIKKLGKKYLPQREVFDEASETFSNPFERLEWFFEEVPLIDIITQEIFIQVPYVSAEEIERQISYLEFWLDRNQQILDERIAIGKSLIGKCDDYEDPEEKASCNQSLDYYLNFVINAGPLLGSVRENIKRLKEYKDFPLKLYEYVHIIDRYLTELTCIVEEFLNSTIGWLDENANRFEKWVDFIILLVGILQTWQVLIDFSVNWRLKCAKCRQDNYDIHSCILSVLCIDLPILPIPPFRIPDIYIDLSHIDLGIDIILPTFRFLPMRLPLLQLPDLPYPGPFDLGLNLQIDLPEIPLLPKLPYLPDLPSFLPTFHLKLPVLPPAPRIPAFLPSLGAIIDIAEFIGMLLCIVKNGIGLVAERSVKSRIEQLTQRTWRVDPFDFFNITFIDPSLQGFDVRVDVFVNLRFRFDMFYKMALSLADQINSITDGITGTVTDDMDIWDYVNDGYDYYPIDDYMDDVDEYGDFDIHPTDRRGNWNDWDDGDDFDSYNNDGKTRVSDTINNGTGGNNNFNDKEISEDEIFSKLNQKFNELEKDVKDSMENKSGYSYEEAYKKLKSGLLYMKTKNLNPDVGVSIDNVLALIDKDNKVIPNTEGIENMKTQFKDLIRDYKNKNNKLEDMIKNNYNGFLNEISKDQLIGDYTQKTTLKASLFKADPDTIDILKQQPHPYKTYIDLNNRLLKKYEEKLDNTSSESLGVNQLVFDNSKNYIKDMRAMADKLSPYFDKDSKQAEMLLSQVDTGLSDDGVAKGVRGAILDQGGSKVLVEKTDIDMSNARVLSGVGDQTVKLTDASQYIKGLFMRGYNGYFYNIVNWEDFGNDIRKKKSFKKVDINKDGQDDVLMWDKRNVYIKYGNQNSNYNSGFVGSSDVNEKIKGYFKYDNLNKPSDLDSKIDQRGYSEIGEDNYKIWDTEDSIDNFVRQGQSFNSISFGWNEKSGIPDGYILETAKRVDILEDRLNDSSLYTDNLEGKRYILVVPKKFDEKNTKVSIPQELDSDFVYNYQKTGKIIDLVRVDMDIDINLTLKNLPKKWHYAKVGGLFKDDDGNMIKMGPWTYQEVGGVQIWSDTSSPVLTVKLIRKKTGQVVSQGHTLKGYLNTNYDIVGEWADNSNRVKSSWIIDEQFNKKSISGSKISLEDLYFTGMQQLVFTFGSMDNAYNVNKHKVVLNIQPPEIKINSVDTKGDNSTIEARLESDIDDGAVKFERSRVNERDILTGNKNISFFEVTTNQDVVTGGFYRLMNDIVLYDVQDQMVAKVDVDTGRLVISDIYKNQVDVKIDTDPKIPMVQINHKLTQKTLFNIYLKPKELVGTDSIVVYGEYVKLPLNNGTFGEYEGGYCISRKSGECVIFISPKGVMYVPQPYNTGITGKYSYIEKGDHILYELYDELGLKIVNVRFRPESLR